MFQSYNSSTSCWQVPFEGADSVRSMHLPSFQALHPHNDTAGAGGDGSGRWFAVPSAVGDQQLLHKKDGTEYQAAEVDAASFIASARAAAAGSGPGRGQQEQKAGQQPQGQRILTSGQLKWLNRHTSSGGKNQQLQLSSDSDSTSADEMGEVWSSGGGSSSDSIELNSDSEGEVERQVLAMALPNPNECMPCCCSELLPSECTATAVVAAATNAALHSHVLIFLFSPPPPPIPQRWRAEMKKKWMVMYANAAVVIQCAFRRRR